MQEPISENISMLEESEITFYDKLDVAMNYVVQSWDTAIKTSNSSDYSVCTVWGVKEGVYYLLHMHRAKLSYPVLKSDAIKISNRYRPKLILIEDHASGQSLLQDLRSEGIANLIGIKQKLDKITRFASIVGLFQSGIVKVPKNAAWIKPFIKELTEFPHSINDDIVDSVSQFLGYIKKSAHRFSNINVREI
jgi:predicted phage terminase large subunit-like protein